MPQVLVDPVLFPPNTSGSYRQWINDHDSRSAELLFPSPQWPAARLLRLALLLQRRQLLVLASSLILLKPPEQQLSVLRYDARVLGESA